MALAEGARLRWPDLPIAFVGATRGIEAQKLPESGWPHLLLEVEGFVGRSPLRMARSAWKLWWAWRKLKARWRKAPPRAVSRSRSRGTRTPGSGSDDDGAGAPVRTAVYRRGA